MSKQFKCKICGYIYKGSAPPATCPQCKAPASEFEELSSSLNKNHSAYILVYTTVIVVVVALLLSLTSGALKARQAANIELDKKKQILSSLPALQLENQDAAALYEQYVKQYVILDSAGNVSKTVDDFNYKPNEDELPLYVASVDGAPKYIIPLNGVGLWGAIWGYIALNEDKNTVYGIYFSHASETPGLGANITTSKFQQQFAGKHLLRDGAFASIAVMKTGQMADKQEQVDALSGATITSKGVETMLKNCIGRYEAFLKNNTTIQQKEGE